MLFVADFFKTRTSWSEAYGNANSWNWYDTPSDIQERIKIIMNGSSNTIYYVVKWIEIVWTKIMNWMGV